MNDFENEMEGEIENEPVEETGIVAAELTPEEVFAELDAVVQAAVPNDRFITFRVETGIPIYVPLNDGEEGISIQEAIIRRGLGVSPTTNAFVENNQVPFSTVVPSGTVVTLIGLVKGGGR